MIDLILLDMDGVVADFVGAALRAHGLPETTHVAQWEMERTIGCTLDEFWRAIDALPDFWRSLRPYDRAREWVDELREIAPVVIASTPSRNPACAGQKVEWLYRHLGEWTCGHYMLGARKDLLARRGHVLIDDNVMTCRRFGISGGDAITFRQPWSSVAYVSVVDSQRDVLERLQALREQSA